MKKLLYLLAALLVLTSCAQAPTEPVAPLNAIAPTPTPIPRAEVIVRPNRRPTPRALDGR